MACRQEVPLDEEKLLSKTLEKLSECPKVPSIHDIIDQIDETSVLDANGAIIVLILAGADVDEIRYGQCVLEKLLFCQQRFPDLGIAHTIKMVIERSQLDYERFFEGRVLVTLRNVLPELYFVWVIYHRSEVEAIHIFMENQDFIQTHEKMCIQENDVTAQLLPVCLKRTFITLAQYLIDWCSGLGSLNYTDMFQVAVRTGNFATLEFILNKLSGDWDRHLLITVVRETLNVDKKNREGFERCFDCVLQLGDVNQTSRKSGSTPLYYACKFEDEYMVSKLIDARAQLVKANNKGKLAVEYISFKALKAHMDSCIARELSFFRGSEVFYDNKHERKVFFSFGLFVDGSEKNHEMDLLGLMVRRNSLNELLCHPLSRAFIALKWRLFRFKIFFYQQCPILSIVVTLIMYITAVLEGKVAFNSLVFWICLVITSISAFAELIRLVISGVRYFRSSTNYLNIVTLLAIFVYLLVPDPSKQTDLMNANKPFGKTAKLQKLTTDLALGTGSILMGLNLTVLMFFVVSEEIGIYLVMLIKVTINSLKFLLSISFILISFGMGFHFTFGNFSKKDDGANSTLNNFHSFGLSEFKTFVMITGELDVSEIDFYNNFLCYVFFAAFVLLIPIVSLNLLNGLAVDDIQKIRKTAEFYCIKIFVSVLTECEHLATSELTEFIVNCFCIDHIFSCLGMRKTREMMQLLHKDIPFGRIYVDLGTGNVEVFDKISDMYTKDNPREIGYKLPEEILELTEDILLNKD